MASGKLIPALHTTFFIGRDLFLQTLRETLVREQAAVIVGPGGAGKTTVALEYIHRFSQEYQQVFWIDASTDESFVAGAYDLMKQLSLPMEGRPDFKTVSRVLQDWLRSQQRFLLILDNVVHSRVVQPMPERSGLKGHTLMLSRDCANIAAKVPRLALELLDEREGALLVLRRSGLLPATAPLDEASDEQRTAARELARELHGSPLALILAGGYLKETGCNIQDYLFSYRDYPACLRQSDDSDNDIAQITCALSFSYLERVQPAALDMLRRYAFLSPDGVPPVLFRQEAAQFVTVSRADGQESKAEEVPFACGLLACQEGPFAVTMHPLVRSAARQALPLAERQKYVEQALRVIHLSLGSLENEPLPERLRVAGWIRELAVRSEDWALSFDEAGEVFGWASSLLWEQELLKHAEFLLRRTLAIWEHTRDLAHPQMAIVLSNLATLNCLLKKYPDAEAFAQRAILASARAQSADHHNVLLYLVNLGHIYAQQDKQREAKSCYEKAIEVGNRAHLQKHPYYINAAYDLAMLYIDNELYKEAEPWLRKVCAAWELSPDTRDQLTLESWLKLAEVSVKLENWQRAEECYERILLTCEKLLGTEHTKTLDITREAASVFLQRGNLARAENCLRRVLTAKERILGDQHPDVAACLNGLARVALGREQIDEASALLKRAQRIYEGRAKPEGLPLAEVLDNVAIIEAVREQYEQAISTLQRALDIRKIVLGGGHLDLVENFINLASLHFILNQADQAEAFFLDALSTYQGAQKPEDFALDPALIGLATIALEREHYWQAKMYLERSRAIRSLELGEKDPRTAEVSHKLALIAVAEQEWEEAEALFRRVLPVYQAALGEEHPQTLECLEQMAAIAARLESFENAKEMLQRVLRVKERGLGDGHPDLTGNLLALGQICLSQEHFEEADVYLQRIITIYERVPDAQPRGVVLLLSGLIMALENQGKQDQADWLSLKVRTLLALST